MTLRTALRLGRVSNLPPGWTPVIARPALNGVALDPIKTRVPTGLLPVRFTAYTYQTAPGQAVQIDVDWVAVMHR